MITSADRRIIRYQKQNFCAKQFSHTNYCRTFKNSSRGIAIQETQYSVLYKGKEPVGRCYDMRNIASHISNIRKFHLIILKK